MFNAQAIVRKSINNATTQFDKLGYVGNDLENYNTYGYKSVRFEQMLREDGYIAGAQRTDCSQGSVRITENPYDVAIEGAGYIPVTSEDGEVQYTRDGSFTVNTEGYLVTKDGDYVLNATGAMNGDPSRNNFIQVDPNATVTVNKMGYVIQNDQVVGTLGVVDVDNYDYLEKYGENMYNLLDGGNRIATDAKVEQGVLETSNVNVVNEMVNMITIQRAYEANQKVITSIDSTLDRAVNNVGRVQQ